ncbi:50S ribosomal protein L30 [Candidatus Woesearchaeota archaeon]|nr:50S ribosomal protein L30 [Candidatus Woesearchaeota archaeon]
MIAIVRIAGQQGLNYKLKTTFKLLNLYKKNSCVVVPNTKVFTGMIRIVKDKVTWGEVDKKTLSLLLEKRGKVVGNRPLTKEYIKNEMKLDFDKFVDELYDHKIKIKDVPGLKPFFRLLPPLKGFERKGTKKPFSMGGALGYRKEKINDLVQRML